MSDRPLPLTEHRGERPALTELREAEIAELVERFYERGRADPLLGPVFEARVEDWEAHLATMRDFWTSAIYRTGRYSGRPFEAHRAIDELSIHHFRRWLALWEETVRQVISTPAVRALLIDFAWRMAQSMSGRLGLTG